jgi:hypothetical protein
MALPVNIASCFGVLEYWSGGVLQNIKFQAPNLRALGFGCQVSGVRKEKHES